MGPFPHDAPRAQIDAQNVAGTDGFEFVEFAHAEPEGYARIFLDALRAKYPNVEVIKASELNLDSASLR